MEIIAFSINRIVFIRDVISSKLLKFNRLPVLKLLYDK